MANIDISDFYFKFSGYGHYTVYYTSPITGKIWRNTISDMCLIDETRNSKNPTKKALNALKRSIKQY